MRFNFILFRKSERTLDIAQVILLTSDSTLYLILFSSIDHTGRVSFVNEPFSCRTRGKLISINLMVFTIKQSLMIKRGKTQRYRVATFDYQLLTISLSSVLLTTYVSLSGPSRLTLGSLKVLFEKRVWTVKYCLVWHREIRAECSERHRGVLRFFVGHRKGSIECRSVDLWYIVAAKCFLINKQRLSVQFFFVPILNQTSNAFAK